MAYPPLPLQTGLVSPETLPLLLVLAGLGLSLAEAIAPGAHFVVLGVASSRRGWPVSSSHRWQARLFSGCSSSSSARSRSTATESSISTVGREKGRRATRTR